jgi:DNA replication protein DnaC
MIDPWMPEERPCEGCGKVLTPGGFRCGPCGEVAAQRNRMRVVRLGAEQLSKAIAAWDWAVAGSDLLRSRVRAQRLRNVAERYTLAHGNLRIVGPSGDGKTITVAALIRRVVDEAIATGDESSPVVGGLWISALELARSAREAPFGTRDPLLGDAIRAPLLVLDELGQERADDRWLMELMEPRYKRGAITITTSGLTLEQLETRYGIGATRRLVEPRGRTIDLYAEAST